MTTTYENHLGLSLNKRLIERADQLFDWVDLIRVEKYCKLILHKKKKFKEHVFALNSVGGPFAKIFCVFIISIVLK